MNEAQFKQGLMDDGYGAAVVVEKQAGETNDMHTHDFGASVFVLEGEITVTTDKEVVTCRVGDSFSLDAGVPHWEAIGGDGVRFLIGRR